MRAERTRRWATVIALLVVVAACSNEPATVTSNPATWEEVDVDFAFESERLHGVLTVPGSRGPHPGLVLISGSGDASGVRANTRTRSFIDHARRLASKGFAVMRYDPPGVGESTGEIGLPSLERRVLETVAALAATRARSEVDPERVGLLGVSQGPWVIAMTAARHPDDVAFLVSVVGSGQSVAEQQVYGIRAQSAAAGLSEEDVTKAVLFGRLLIDWQLSEPLFRQANERDLASMPEGPWQDMAALVYRPGEVDPRERLDQGVEVLRRIKDEPWARALYLEELWLPRFESIPADIDPELLRTIQLQAEQSLLTDPEEFWTRVRVPVLAIFGENDLNVDSELSAVRYAQYLTEAGNPDFTIEILPGVGHSITLATPGYWDLLSTWLADRFSE